ncbi:MAG TPA: LysM peptidoglycan-binding domain-containing protein [Syntrophales bacterium]|nr:LysM peptidoglycan-binding domain-containing protein [Syntrophales bacterium]
MINKRRLYVFVTLLIAGLFAFVIGGCCPKKPAETAAPAEETVAVTAVAVAEEVPPKALEEVEAVVVVEEVVIPAPEMEYHLVKRGECLWWIAEYEDVYNDPFMWPIIYDANKDKISNPDLIYPGQELKIPRLGYTMDDLQEMRRSAGAPRPYAPPEGAQLPIQ